MVTLMDGCLSLYVSPAMNWWLVQCVPCLRPKDADAPPQYNVYDTYLYIKNSGSDAFFYLLSYTYFVFLTKSKKQNMRKAL